MNGSFCGVLVRQLKSVEWGVFMVSKYRILIGLLALLVTTEPIVATSTNRFRSAYKTVRADIRCLFGNEKIDDPEQKKRIIIEVAAGIAIMLVTGTVIWIWWVRPLQKQLKNDPDESFENMPPITISDSEQSSLQHTFRCGKESLLEKKIDEMTVGDLSQPDEYGNTVLHYAASRHLPKAVAKLIEKRLKIDAQSGLDETPLHWAALSNQETIVQLLLKEGANPTLVNKKGDLPRQLTNNKTIQGILEQAERKWTEKDKK